MKRFEFYLLEVICMYEVDKYTVSLLHFEDGLKDECGNVWQAYNGATTIDAEGLFKGKCLLLNGQKQFIQTNTTFDFGNEDLTIDFLVVVKSFTGSSTTPYHGICTSMATSDYKGLIFEVHSDDYKFAMCLEDDSKVSLNTLYHIAIVRHSGKWSLAINGKFLPWTPEQQTKFLANYTQLSNITLGRGYTDYDDYYANVCISEFRISKGIARWTSDFAPQALLRITMNDSSEREYKIAQADVDKFTQWINGAGKTGDNCYKFDDVIEGSKEYLIFEKIISFKVIPLAQ
jgi:hypothetical protein